MLALRWAWFVLVALALAYTALVTRYKILSNSAGDTVFDRWTQEWCNMDEYQSHCFPMSSRMYYYRNSKGIWHDSKVPRQNSNLQPSD